MGVSFKVSRTGWRYRTPELPESTGGGGSFAAAASPEPVYGDGGAGAALVDSFEVNDGYSISSTQIHSEGHEASFAINLYADGFSIGKPAEGMLWPLVQDVPELLHPYDKTALTLFSAIENGWLPGDILDDIPCKYHNGTVICEVWDFRTCVSKMNDDGSCTDEFPIFQKVQLKMCMENVIKDLPSILDDSLMYSDLLQAESRIMKVLQPVLCLDPTPALKRHYASPISNKIDLQIHHGRPKVKPQDKLGVDRNPSNILYEGDTSRNEIFDGFMALDAFGDGARSCAEHAIAGTKLNLHQRDIWNDVLGDNLKAASKINGRQEIISAPVAETNTVPSSALYSEEDPSVSHSRTSSEPLPGKRQTSNIQPTPKYLLKKPKIEHLHSGPHQQVASQKLAISDGGVQCKSNHLPQQLKVIKMKNQSHESNHSQLATSEPLLQVVSKTQPDEKFSANRRGVSSIEIVESPKIQKHAIDASSAMPRTQHATPGAMVNMQQINSGNNIIGRDFSMASHPNHKHIATSISEVSAVVSSVSHSERDLRASCSGLRTSAVLSGKRQRNSHQPAPNPLLKRAKIEPLQLAPRQDITGQMNILSKPGLQQNSRNSQPQVDEQIFEAVSKARSGVHLYSDKRNTHCEVMAETTVSEKLCGPLVGSSKEDHLGNVKCNVSNQGQPLQSQASHVRWKHSGLSVDRSSGTEGPPQGIKQISARGLAHPLELSNVGSYSESSSVQVNTITVLAQRNFSYSLKDTRVSGRVMGGPENLDYINAPLDAATPLIADLSVLPPIVTEDGNSILDRFSQIQILTERYALNRKRSKKSDDFGRKAFPHSPQLLSELLKSKDTEGNRCINESCISKNYCVGSGCAYKARVLTFEYSEILHGGFQPRARLFLCEYGEPNHEVEAWIILGDREQPIHFALLPNTCKADIFVNQFISLMKQEGYKLEDDQFPSSAAWTMNGASEAAADPHQVSQHRFSTSVSGQIRNLFCNMGSCVSTVNLQLCPFQTTSPGQLLPPFYNLAQPQVIGNARTFSNMLLHHHRTQMSIMVSKELHMEKRMLGWPAHLKAFLSHEYQLYQPHLLSWINAGNIMGAPYVSNLSNTGVVSNSTCAIHRFCSLNNQLFSGGTSIREMRLLATKRNAMRNTPDLRVGLDGTGSSLGQVLSKSHFDSSLCISKFPVDFPMLSSMNLGVSNYSFLHNDERWCLGKHIQQHVGVHHQHVCSSLVMKAQQTTQFHQCTVQESAASLYEHSNISNQQGMQSGASW